MAHGAPDHVRMGDVNIMDYLDQSFLQAVYVIPGLTTWTCVDVTGVGSIGLVYFLTNFSELDLEIWIDGVLVFDENPTKLRFYHTTVGVPLSNFCGVGCYDAVTPLYSLWVDYHFLRPFKQSMQIIFRNDLGFPKNINDVRCYWKEKV